MTKLLLKRNCLQMLMILLAAFSSAMSAEPPDLILINGIVVTMDTSDSIAEAIAIRGEEIVATGSATEMAALAGPETQTIELAGAAVTPGIIDTHNHFAWGALDSANALDIEYPAVRSIEDIRERVQQRANALEAGEWITGSKWDAAKLREQRNLSAADLDSVAADNPVWLLHTSAHYGVANSRALALAGVDASTADPEGGVIERDEQGNPTGILTDQAMALVLSVTPPVTADDFAVAIAANVKSLNAEGITTIKDPEIDARQWDAYQAVRTAGDLTMRVFTLWRAPDTYLEAERLLARIAPFTNPREKNKDPHVISGGVKIYVDGSGTVRTAWMYEDWNEHFTEVDEGNKGLTYLAPADLAAQVRLFHDAGIHIGSHAIGDRAIDFIMDTYADVLSKTPVSGLRHSIIHANLPTLHAMDLMSRLQQQYDAAYPEVQPAFLWWIGDAYAANFGAERSQRVLPLQTFEKKGIRWAGSSDYDVSPFAPRVAFWAAVNRETMLGTHGLNPWGSEESVSVHAVLAAYTRTAARQVFLEDRIGSLEAGKLADIVVWDRDPFSTLPALLRDMRPIITLFNGEVVYRAASAP